MENKVGYLRRNELVPVPEFPILAEKNKELLRACDQDMEREHYDKGRTVFLVRKSFNDASGRLHITVISQQYLALQKQRTQRNSTCYIYLDYDSRQGGNFND